LVTDSKKITDGFKNQKAIHPCVEKQKAEKYTCLYSAPKVYILGLYYQTMTDETLTNNNLY
jgi:hypothetical protein